MQELGDLEDVEEGAIKIAKKKLPKVEESKSKKEHVNVVFIGHVGKWIQVDSSGPRIHVSELCD